MPTFACYAAQVAILFMAMTFGLRAYRAESYLVGGLMVVVFLTVALGWGCHYTIEAACR